MARAVTVHTYSQRVAHRLGVVPCGILLGYFPKTHQYRGISENLENRVTAELGFMYLDSPTEVQIYPPEHHRQMILQLYGNIGMKPQVKIPGDNELAACKVYSVMRTSYAGASGILRIDVSRCGINVLKEIQATLREFRLKGVDLIHVYLNLFDPVTCMLTKQLEDLGFFFAGILPGGIAEGDALILQCLNNVPIQYDNIHLELDQAKTILSYVSARNSN
jgi:serine/threonine-protein kinase RsbW